MTIATLAVLNGLLVLGLVALLAAVMRIPFSIDRAETEPAEASVHAFASPLPLDLAA
jgi:hypothetical protein